MNKKYIIIIILVASLITIGLYKHFTKEKPFTSVCKPVSDTEQLYLIRNRNYYAFVNQNNEVKITVDYTTVTPFNHEGISIVHNFEKSDLMDQSCQLKSNFSYNYITENKNIPGYYFARKDNEVLVINKNNDILFHWDIYYDLTRIPHNMYILRMKDDTQGQKYGLYELKDGVFRELLKPVYGQIYYINDEYQDGLIVYFRSESHAGYLDTLGNQIVFDEVNYFDANLHSGYTFVRKGTKWALMKNNGTLVTDYQYDYTNRTTSGGAIVKNNNKWTFIDTTGKLLTNYEYDDVFVDQSGFTRVKKGNYWGYMSPDLKLITDIKYSSLDSFQNDIAVVLRDGLYTIINTSGQELTSPQYDHIGNFYTDYALVRKDGKYGFINKDGKEIIEAKYDDLFTMGYNGTFIDRSVISNRIAVKYNNKWGYIDKTGKTIIDCSYDLLYPFDDNYVAVSKDNLWGVLNIQTGEIVANLLYNKITSYLGDGKFSVTDSTDSNSEKTIDIGAKHQGDIEYRFPDITIYSLHEKYGLMNKEGQIITDALYDRYQVVKDGIIVSKDNKFGKVDFNGNILIPIKYEGIRMVQNRDDLYAFVKENGKWGIVDQNFHYIIEPKYDNINISFDPLYPFYSDYLYHEYLPVEYNGKWGVVNIKQNYSTVLDFKYDSVVMKNNLQLILVKYNGKYGLFDFNGKEILKPKYNYIILE